MLQEMLRARNLPGLLPREQMLEMLHKEVFGFLPAKPESLTFEDAGKVFPRFCSGDAECRKIVAKCVIGGKDFSFPFYTSLPTDGKKHPFFVLPNFTANIPDRYLPAEELIDNGFAVLSFDYQDVTNDKDDFTDGLAGILYENGERADTDPGKIAMWAWAAQRVMDYAQTRGDVLDLDCGIVCGHSRLGKTALLTAATDPRFAFCYSNDSGCTGAALSRGKVGEDVDFIVSRTGSVRITGNTEKMSRVCLLISIFWLRPLRPGRYWWAAPRRTNGLIRCLNCCAAWRRGMYSPVVSVVLIVCRRQARAGWKAVWATICARVSIISAAGIGRN